MDFNPVILHPYQKEKFGCLDTHRGKYQVKIKAKIGSMHWQVKKGQRFPENHQSLGREVKNTSPSQPSSFQNYEMVHLYHLTTSFWYFVIGTLAS